MSRIIQPIVDTRRKLLTYKLHVRYYASTFSNAYIPFELTTEKDGVYKEEYDKTINYLAAKFNIAVSKADRLVAEAFTRNLRKKLTELLQVVGIEAKVVSVKTSNGGYTYRSGKYRIVPNIIVKLSRDSTAEEIEMISYALNKAADQVTLSYLPPGVLVAEAIPCVPYIRGWLGMLEPFIHVQMFCKGLYFQRSFK
jgi:hypothetical protein